MRRRIKPPEFVLDCNAPTCPRRQAEMDLFDRLPAGVRAVIHQEGVKAMKEYLCGNVHRFNHIEEGAEYEGWE